MRSQKSLSLRFVTLVFLTMLGAVHIFSAQTNAAQPTDKTDKLYVVTTIQQIGDVARQIAGDHIQLDVIMGAGVDPHLYRPTRSDVIRMKKADIIFYNGLNLEGQMHDFLEKMSHEKPVIAVGSAVQQDILLRDENNKHDPHIWMNVKAWSSVTDVISQTLQDAIAAHKNEITQNTTLFKDKLGRLESYVQNAYKSIPPQQRTLITAHDAFGYLGQAYGIKVIGIQGISTESEAGLHRIEGLVETIVTDKIPAVFIETSVSERNISALIEGAKAKEHNIAIGGTLYSDAMGAWDSYTGTYIGMIDYNTTVIVRALGGNAPASGMNNKLTLH